jgi:hypothetical protein
MNTMLSGLNQMCEEFFLYQDLMSDPQREVRLLRQYCKRGDKQRADKLFAKLEAKVSKPVKSGLESYERLEILDSMDSYYVSYDKRKLRNRHLLDSLRNLDYYFILQTLTFQKEMLSGKFYAEDLTDESLPLKLLKLIDFEKLISMIEKDDPENSILLRIYFLIVKNLEKNFDEKKYTELKDIVVENLNDLDFQTGKYLLLNLQVIIAKRLNEGRLEFEKELYEISKMLIDGRFYDNDKNWFRASHFRTIIKLGIRLNDIDYIEKFIENYFLRLEPNLRKALKHFAAANVCFAKKQYDESLNNIIKADLKDQLFNIDSRRLMAKIYYETDSMENLQSLLDAFAHFLKTIKSSDQIIIRRNLNFIKYLKKLVKLKEKNADQFDTDQIITGLKKENISEIRWLMKNISELNVRQTSQKSGAG